MYLSGSSCNVSIIPLITCIPLTIIDLYDPVLSAVYLQLLQSCIPLYILYYQLVYLQYLYDQSSCMYILPVWSFYLHGQSVSLSIWLVYSGLLVSSQLYVALCIHSIDLCISLVYCLAMLYLVQYVQYTCCMYLSIQLYRSICIYTCILDLYPCIYTCISVSLGKYIHLYLSFMYQSSYCHTLYQSSLYLVSLRCLSSLYLSVYMLVPQYITHHACTISLCYLGLLDMLSLYLSSLSLVYPVLSQCILYTSLQSCILVLMYIPLPYIVTIILSVYTNLLSNDVRCVVILSGSVYQSYLIHEYCIHHQMLCILVYSYVSLPVQLYIYPVQLYLYLVQVYIYPVQLYLYPCIVIQLYVTIPSSAVYQSACQSKQLTDYPLLKLTASVSLVSVCMYLHHCIIDHQYSSIQYTSHYSVRILYFSSISDHTSKYYYSCISQYIPSYMYTLA